jgi:hypothetical protein
MQKYHLKQLVSKYMEFRDNAKDNKPLRKALSSVLGG